MKQSSRQILGLVLACMLCGAGLVQAQTRQPIVRTPVESGPMRVSLEVLVDGQPMPTIFHEGKTYLPVPKLGAEYAIRVTNHGPRRVVAMISVDGLSVISGQPASETQSGYVLSPRGQIVIKGWRRDMNTVAAFSFQERDKSYAALMGRPENVGVIGLVAIEELTARPAATFAERNARTSAAPQRSVLGSTGTGYGRDIDSPIYYVPFVRSNNRRTVTIYYDTVDALRAAGVPVDRPMPNPFPADHEFAPPPPGDGRR